MLIGSWEGGKNFRVGILLSKNLLGFSDSDSVQSRLYLEYFALGRVGLQETNNFIFRPNVFPQLENQ